MASDFRHNKKRNTALVYEFLVRKLTGQMVGKDPAGKLTLDIVQRYFADGQVMAIEHELFETVVSTRGVNESVARKVLSEVVASAKKVDMKQLDAKKSSLIKEVHRLFGQQFFDVYRLPEYRLLASVQLYLDGCRSAGRLSENVARIKLEQGLVSYMTSSSSSKPGWSQDSEVDSLVCQLASRKFEEKYGRTFSGRQKSLLELYSRSVLTEDRDAVAQKLYEDKREIMQLLEKNGTCPEVQNDTVLRERFVEATRKLASLDVTKADDERVEEMLLYWKLCEEVSSDV